MAALLALCSGTAAFSDSLSGSYLAGQHAARLADVDQAGRFFARALARDPGNPVLMGQALIYQTAAGRVDRALSIADELLLIDPTQFQIKGVIVLLFELSLLKLDLLYYEFKLQHSSKSSRNNG